MLLDSNIIIYAVKPGYSRTREFVKQHAATTSSISRIETLGYHRLTGEEKSKFERLFEVLTVRPIPEPIIRKAIDLRRRRRGMATVDAVIAATAIASGNPLATHNATDFDWIGELEVVDPVSSS